MYDPDYYGNEPSDEERGPSLGFLVVSVIAVSVIAVGVILVGSVFGLVYFLLAN